ncbi:MAG: TIGR03943 family protein [Chloroflexota bacterium]
MKPSLKAVILIGMGLFLYSRFFNGKLLFYINERFVWLTLLASVGFIVVGASYRYYTTPAHDHGDHQHGYLSRGGILLVILPMILGMLVPPQPLGAAAMGSRDVSPKALTSAAAPQRNEVLTKPKSEKNILDWLIEFRSINDPAAFTGQQARLIGFVYRDEQFAADEFMVSRFVISCCAADAVPLGLVVRWPETASLTADQWVEVNGRFEPGQFGDEALPILIAESITPAQTPDQPYLYPY